MRLESNASAALTSHSSAQLAPKSFEEEKKEEIRTSQTILPSISHGAAYRIPSMTRSIQKEKKHPELKPLKRAT